LALPLPSGTGARTPALHHAEEIASRAIPQIDIEALRQDLPVPFAAAWSRAGLMPLSWQLAMPTGKLR